MGVRCARPHDLRRRPADDRRGRRRDPARRPARASSSAASSSTPSSPRWTGAAWRTSSGPGQPITRPTGPLSRGDRAADPPGHRGLLPGGPRRDAPARRPTCRAAAAWSTSTAAAAAGSSRWPAASRSSSSSASSSRPTRSPGRAPPIEAEGLADRIEIRHGKATDPGHVGEYDLAYFQYALHQLHDAPTVLAAAWAALRPGGRIVVLDWPLPSNPDEFRTRHGELIAGVQLDELYQGTALATREQFLAWFDEAGLPAPARHRPAVGRVGVRCRAAGLTFAVS